MRSLVLEMAMMILLSGFVFSQSRKYVKVEVLSDWDGKSDKFYLGVKFSIDRGWYIYWRNPGDAGLAPEIKLTLPNYLKAGEVQFPLPQKIVHGDIISYGYFDEVILLIPIQIVSKFDVEKSDLIKVNLNWLVCSESCVPGQATLDYKIRPSTISQRNVIERYRKLLPKKFESSGLSVRDFKVEKRGNSIYVKIEFSGENAKKIVDFYPDVLDKFLIDFKSVKVKDGVLELKANAVDPKGNMNFISGIIVVNNEGYELKLNLTKTK